MAPSCPLLGLLTLFMGIWGVYCQANNYNEIMDSLKYTEKLIFDISIPSDVPSENIEVSTSPVMLYCKRVFADYVGDSGTYNGSNPDLDWFRKKIVNDSKGLCFLLDRPSNEEKFNSTYSTLSNSVDEFMNNFEIKRDKPFKIIFSLVSERSGNFKYYVTHDLINFFKSRWTNVTIGMELETDSVETSGIRLAQLVIVNIDIPTEKFLLGYTSFKSALRARLDQRIEFVQRANPYCTIYAKLNFPPPESRETIHLTDDEYKKYYFHLLQFSVFWINDGEKEGIILKSFNTTLAFQEGLDGVALRNILSSDLSWADEVIEDKSCEMKALLGHVSTSIKTVTIDAEFAEYLFLQVKSCIITNGSTCPSDTLESDICNRPTGDAAIPDITIKLRIDESLSESRYQLDEAANILVGLPIKQVELILGPSLNQTDQSSFSSFIVGLRGEILPSETTFACAILTFEPYNNVLPNDPNFVQKVNDVCSFMWNETEAVVWEFDFNAVTDLQSLTSRLMEIEQNRKLFLKRFPGKSVLLRVHKFKVGRKPSGFTEFTLYCRPEVLELNERVDIIVNFARIHNIPIDVKPVLDPERLFEWYSLVSTVEELDIAETKYPVFVARNYPHRFLAGKFQTDPCIKWTTIIPKDGIAMNTKYSGTTLDIRSLKNATLTSGELQTILQFTFHKFALVEIVLGSVSDINLVLSVLSDAKFVRKLLAQESHQPNFYFRIVYEYLNFDKIELRQFTERVEKLIFKPVGLHLVNWENFENVEKFHMDTLSASGIMIGISLEDCVDEVNANFQNSRTLQWFNHVDYLLCNIEYSQETTNSNKFKMEKYLDTTLYIKRYFHRLFPNTSKESLFRLNAVPLETDFVGEEGRKVEFLKFYSDVSQYATAYEIKFFMLPTFDDGHVAGRRNGWWKILNFNDLANLSVFIDREAEYLGGESWRPPPDPLSEVIWTWSRIVFIALGVIIAGLVGSVLCLRARYQRRFALLSKKEVDNFLEGCGDEDEETFESRKFPKEYEIPRSNFLLVNIIGSGNFGVIYNATLSTNRTDDSIPVAVKVPNSNCSKETFRTFLYELKVLCYVGSHPHVLEFIGAHTKEIGRGITYIATALCENGALLGYLRKLQLKELPDDCEAKADVVCGNMSGNINHTDKDEGECSETNKLQYFELCRFSREIALGMDYIASKKIVHGDLSTRNVLLDSELCCKIGDFGLSRKLYEYQEYVKTTSEAMPWRWLAIESLKRMEFTTKSDVWSYGITLWEIFSLGCTPYPGLSWTLGFVEDLENGLRMSAPKFCSSEIYDKMSTCWELDPEQRPTFHEMAEFFVALRDEQYIQL